MKRNFTLIEILSVTLLISLLAAIGIAGYTYAMESSKESATKAMIVRLTAAFEALREEGLLPKTDVGNGTEYVAVIFNDDPTTAVSTGKSDGLRYKVETKHIPIGDNNTKRMKAYKIFAKNIGTDNIERHINSDKEIIDGWGNPIYVRYPGKINKGGFDIISAGSNGTFGENEAAAPPDDITEYLDDDGEWICDDVANI